MDRWLSTRTRQALAILMLSCGLSGVVRADRVVLKNGNVLTGVIRRIDHKTVTIVIQKGTDVKIPLTAVRTMRSRNRVDIVGNHGKIHRAAVAESTSAVGWQEVPYAAQNRTPSVIPTLAPQSQPARAARTNAVKPPPPVGLFGPYWKNRLTLGLVNASGNTDQTETAGALLFHYKRGQDELTLDFNAAYGSTNGKQDQSFAQGHFVYRKLLPNWHPHRHWYLFVANRELYDGIKGISLRSTTSAGLGYYLVKNKRLEADVRAGPGFLYEQLFHGQKRTDPTGAAALRVIYHLDKSVMLSQEVTYDQALTSQNQYNVTSDSSVLVKLDQVERGLGMSFSFDDDYDNTASASGRKPNDTRLVIGLTLNF
jgi:putative salt-induced outer membrane protein YdiY